MSRDAENNFETYVNTAVVAVSTKEPQILEDNKVRINNIETILSTLEKEDTSYKAYVAFAPLLEQIHKISLQYITELSSDVKVGDRKIEASVLNLNNEQIQNVKKDLGKIKQKAEHDFEEAAEHTSQLNNQFIFISAVTLGTIILIVILFSIFLLGSILKRISRLKDHFSATNIDALEPIENTGEDELGDLVKVSNTMLMSIKKSRSELIEKAFVENIINTLNDILIVSEGDWKIIRVNSQGLEFFGKSQQSLYGSSIFESIQRNESRMGLSIEAMQAELTQKGVLKSEAFLNHQQELIPVHISAALMGQTLKHEKTYVFSIRDIRHDLEREHEKQMLQAQLAQSSKLASLGTLGAGIAHELANPLSAIMGYAELFRISKEIHPKFREFGNTIIRCGKRMAVIINEFRNFSRDTSDLELETFPIHLAVEGVLIFFQHKTISMGIDIQLDFTKEDDCVFGNHNQIESVFLNFLTNSCDSFAEITDDRKKFIKVKNYSEKDALVITFEDNAMGIPPEKIKNIFDPFFTTKQVGSGTGLGLFIVHQILEKHKCTIEVSSTRNQGTRFTLRFPKAQISTVSLDKHTNISNSQ
jgi:PAS domain S-box-containing protein